MTTYFRLAFTLTDLYTTVERNQLFAIICMGCIICREGRYKRNWLPKAVIDSPASIQRASMSRVNESSTRVLDIEGMSTFNCRAWLNNIITQRKFSAFPWCEQSFWFSEPTAFPGFAATNFAEEQNMLIFYYWKTFQANLKLERKM